MGKKLEYSFVKAGFEKEGYELLSEEYLGNKQKLEYRCPKGHNHAMTWGNWDTNKRRCPECCGRIMNKSRVVSSFQREGYTLLSQYKNSGVHLDYICDQGHRHSMSWANWSRGHRCPACNRGVVDPDLVLKSFESEGYIVTKGFKNTSTKIEYICPKGTKRGQLWGSWKRGSRCQCCAKTGFKLEKPGRLYYLRFLCSGDKYYKVGITNKTIRERYSHEKRSYKVLMEKPYLFGFMAFEEEQSILQRFKRHIYSGKKRILDTGNTELFTKDVLRLDVSTAL